MRVSKFTVTTRALQRMEQRGLNVEAMQDTLKYASETQMQYRPGEHKGIVYRFSKMRGEVKLTVVAEVCGQECWILTGWL